MTCYILNFTLFHICGLLFLLYQPDFFLFTFVDVSGQPEAHGFPPRTCISIKCKKISGAGGGWEGVEHVLILFLSQFVPPS